MFKKNGFDSPPDKVNTVVGKGTYLKGTVNATGLTRIDGETEGDITGKGDLIIGESGKVTGDINARNVTIAGFFEGTLQATGKLELKRTAIVAGTIKTSSLLVEEGGTLNGTMDMQQKGSPASKELEKKPAGPTPAETLAGKPHQT